MCLLRLRLLRLLLLLLLLLLWVLHGLVVSLIGTVLEGRFILPPAAVVVVHAPRERVDT